MVPLIDVVFLLLIFFIMTVNFSQQEGFLAAELPANTQSTASSEIDPLAVYISSLANADCQVVIGNEAVIVPQGADFSSFISVARRVIEAGMRNSDDPIILIDSPDTSWQHMLNVYDALMASNFTNIIFSGN